MCNITPQASERICKHMNEDHGVSVYAMVLATLANTGSAESKMKISNCQLKNISLTQMDLSFVACDSTNGGSCLLKDMVIHFDPPLESSRDMRPRLVKLHHEHLSPKFSWLVTEPICRIVLLSVLALGYFNQMGLDAFALDIENHAPAFFKTIIDTLFGSVESLFTGVQVSFKFAIVAHVLEAIYAAYLCKATLKMKIGATYKWFLLTSMVGYPMTSRVMDFAKVHKQSKKKQN